MNQYELCRKLHAHTRAITFTQSLSERIVYVVLNRNDVFSAIPCQPENPAGNYDVFSTMFACTFPIMRGNTLSNPLDSKQNSSTISHDTQVKTWSPSFVLSASFTAIGKPDNVSPVFKTQHNFLYAIATATTTTTLIVCNHGDFYDLVTTSSDCWIRRCLIDDRCKQIRLFHRK